MINKKNYIYITGGKFKGRKIYLINNNKNLRPTLSYIKEILFNWLKYNIKNSYCLDCFAGSGSLGIEALSRRAKFVNFIDNDFKTISQLKKNIYFINKKKIKIYNINFFKFIKNKRKKKYNIIFLDPPYKKKIIKNSIHLLLKSNLLSKKCYIYIENKIYNQRIVIPENWYLFKRKIFRNKTYELYKNF